MTLPRNVSPPHKSSLPFQNELKFSTDDKGDIITFQTLECHLALSIPRSMGGNDDVPMGWNEPFSRRSNPTYILVSSCDGSTVTHSTVALSTSHSPTGSKATSDGMRSGWSVVFGDIPYQSVTCRMQGTKTPSISSSFSILAHDDCRRF